MPPSICLFCKRCANEFCYNIYDKESQPHLSIDKLFGNVSDLLQTNRVVCFECLYLIRWIYFMKQVFAEMMLEKDIPDNPRIVAAFNIFKEKINQRIFLQDDEDDAAITEVEQAAEGALGPWPQSNSHHPDMNPIDLTTTINNNQLPKDKSSSKATQIDGITSAPSDVSNTMSYFACRTTVCEQRFDTFDEIISHYDLHHGVDGGDIVLEDYADQLHEYNIQGLTNSPQNEKKFKFRCLLSICKRGLHSIESLTTHKIRDHNLMAKFKCAECFDLPFTSQIDLNQHIYESHQGIGLSCIYCSLSFTSFRHYQIHIEEHVVSMRLCRRSSSADPTEYVCKFCDKMFLDVSLLNAHVQSHSSLDGEGTMILKCYHSKDGTIASIDKKADKNRADCAFRTRVQQASTPLITSHPENNVVENGTLMNIVQSVSANPMHDNGDRLRISLPPRKRRNYAIAVEEVEQIELGSPIVVEEGMKTTTSASQVEENPISSEFQHNPDVIIQEEPPLNSESSIEEMDGNGDSNEGEEDVVPNICSNPSPSESIAMLQEEGEEDKEMEDLDSSIESIEETIKMKQNQAKEVPNYDEPLINKSVSPLPCIVKTIEAVEPNANASSGTLRMTISLKSIEKYKDNMEKQKNHNKLKRKKHSKAKKKSKHSKENDIRYNAESESSERLHMLETFAPFNGEDEETITLQVINSEPGESEQTEEEIAVCDLAEQAASTSRRSEGKKMKKAKKSQGVKKKGIEKGQPKVTLPSTDSDLKAANRSDENPGYLNRAVILISEDEDAGAFDACIPEFLKAQCTISSQTVIVPNPQAKASHVATNDFSNDALFSESDENAVPLHAANELVLNRDEINKIILGDRVCNDLPNLKTVAVNERLICEPLCADVDAAGQQDVRSGRKRKLPSLLKAQAKKMKRNALSITGCAGNPPKGKKQVHRPASNENTLSAKDHQYARNS